MKGIIFNNLEEMVVSKLGKEGWATVLSHLRIPMKNILLPDGTYEDADLIKIVEMVANKSNQSVVETWKDFGKSSIESLIRQYPDVVAPYKTLKELLENIHEMHFGAVMKLFSNPILPYLSLEERSTDKIFVVRYKSVRNICFYLEGALVGAAAYYKQTVTTSQSSCTYQGSNVCEIEILFK